MIYLLQIQKNEFYIKSIERIFFHYISACNLQGYAVIQ